MNTQIVLNSGLCVPWHVLVTRQGLGFVIALIGLLQTVLQLALLQIHYSTKSSVASLGIA